MQNNPNDPIRGTFGGEVRIAWRRFWSLGWGWKASVLAAIVLIPLGIVASATNEEEANHPATLAASASETTAAVSQTRRATPSDTTTSATKTNSESETAVTLVDRVRRSIVDNRNAVGSPPSLDSLSLNIDAGQLSLALNVNRTETDSSFLTIGSALGLIAGKAVWTTYPEIVLMHVSVVRPDDIAKPVTYMMISRETGLSFDYAGLKDQPSKDNKSLYCQADFYQVSFALWDSLGTKGCLVLPVGGSRLNSDQRSLVQQTLSSVLANPQRKSSPPMAAVGQSVILPSDGWVLTVVSAYKIKSVASAFERKMALGIYVVVELTMENVSKEAHSLGGDRFSISDDRARKYDYYSDGTYIFGQQELGSRINAGLKAPARMLFDVPADATGLVFKSLGGFQVAIGNVAALPLK